MKGPLTGGPPVAVLKPPSMLSYCSKDAESSFQCAVSRASTKTGSAASGPLSSSDNRFLRYHSHYDEVPCGLIYMYVCMYIYIYIYMCITNMSSSDKRRRAFVASSRRLSFELVVFRTDASRTPHIEPRCFRISTRSVA